MRKVVLLTTLLLGKNWLAGADTVTTIAATSFTSTYSLQFSDYAGGNPAANTTISGGQREGSSGIFPEGTPFPLLWSASGYQAGIPASNSSGVFGSAGPVVYTGGVLLSSPAGQAPVVPGTFEFSGTAKGSYTAYSCYDVGLSFCGGFGSGVLPAAPPVGTLTVDLPGTITLEATRAIDGDVPYDVFTLSFVSAPIATPEPGSLPMWCVGAGVLYLAYTRTRRSAR